jgi:nucleotide-binding universal stress UspA family protein
MASEARRAPRVIILGTDFSAGSQNALSRAIQLAKRHGAAVHVVHAAPSIPRAIARKFSFADDRKLRAALDGLTDQIREAGLRARPHLTHGDPVKALTVKARALAADLVVVGARGRAAADAMIGSTAERFIALDRHRVLLVRRPATRAYGEVLIAANEESRLADQLAAAALFSSDPPSVLHVYEGPFESVLRLHGASGAELRSYRELARREAAPGMTKLMEKAGLQRARLVLRHGSAVQLLQRVARDSLLVLSRGRSVVRHLLFGSVTRAVVAHGGSDVLLV